MTTMPNPEEGHLHDARTIYYDGYYDGMMNGGLAWFEQDWAKSESRKVAVAAAGRIAASNPHSRREQMIADIIRDVAELPDRSSPDDWPEAMLVTAQELHNILADQLAESCAKPQEEGASNG